MITIIDYKSGNLKSISNGFKKIGVEYQITDDKDVMMIRMLLQIAIIWFYLESEHLEALWKI